MSKENDDLIKELERKLSDVNSKKTEVFEKVRPYNDELQDIVQRERECSDKLNRLRTEKHDREAHEQLIQRIVKMESEMKQLTYDNEKLVIENDRSADLIKNLKQSLDQSTNYSKTQKQKIAELQGEMSATEMKIPPIAANNEENRTYSELQKQLNLTTELLGKTKEELIETRQRLSYVQERLTVAEQVTAATQQRALQESANDSGLELTAHQPTKATGMTYLGIDY